VDQMTQRRGNARTQARERPALDPALALLIAAVLVLLALAVGTGLFLLLPATL
jgi:cytochrome b